MSHLPSPAPASAPGAVLDRADRPDRIRTGPPVPGRNGHPDPMVPTPYRVEGCHRETPDTVTLTAAPVDGEPPRFAPGQISMLYVYGVGEVPISMSGDPARPGPFVFTIRSTGEVTRYLTALGPGDTIGVRGPFGVPWPVDQAQRSDVVFVAGGLGLAPLRSAFYTVLANRERYGRVVLLYGARTPADLLYRDELQRWRGRFDLEVEVTVDTPGTQAPRAFEAPPSQQDGWLGNVGVVTKLFNRARFDPHHTQAFLCGPEIMMRFGVQGLLDLGVPAGDIWVSLERNMRCAVGFCGHCQFGPTLLCKDGPVFRWDRVEHFITIREV